MKAISYIGHISLSISVPLFLSIFPIYGNAHTILLKSPDIIANDTTSKEKLKNITDTIPTLSKKQTGTKADSTTVMLPETTVEAKNFLHTAKKSIYTPEKRDKNVSFNSMDLLKRMNIPQLTATPSGSLTAVGGAQISYFINGIPASAEELRGMNVNDVNKVEYLDFPEDANFMGAEHVVNFIVRKYEYGGYTRADLHHQYINGFILSENIFSKFSYKRMTYDLVLNSSIRGDNSLGSDSEETYRLPSGTVTKHLTTLTGKYRVNTIVPIKFRALYSHGSTYISNTIGYQSSDVFRQHMSGEIKYDGFQSPEYTYSSNSPYKNKSLTWDGNASFNAGRGWSMSASGNLYYTNYNYRNNYVLSVPGNNEGSPVSDIKNYVDEDSFNGRLSFMANKRFSGRHSINLMANWAFNNSRMRYLENKNRNKFSSNNFSVQGSYNLTLSKLYLALQAGLSYEDSEINGYKVNKPSPFGALSLRYALNWKNSITLSMNYSMTSPGMSSKNTELVQRNEIMYTVGNPDLKPYPVYNMGLNYLFQPSNNFYISPIINWAHSSNTFHSMYVPMEGKLGMLQTYENSGHTDEVSLSMNCALYLFNRKLVLTAAPVYKIQHTSYPEYPTMHPWYIYATATGYFGNFYVSGNFYSGKSAGYTSPNMSLMSDRPHLYWLDLGWGNGKVTANMRILNIFRKKCDDNMTLIRTPYYSSTSISKLGDRQRIIINLAYTFGYGKKVNRNDEISRTVSTSGSGVNL